MLVAALPFLILLAGLLPTPTTPTTANKLGIGVYTDTPQSPPYPLQLDAALNLTGAQGFVTLYLCAWRTDTASCMNESTTTIDAESQQQLLAAYHRNLTVVARIGNPRVVNHHADRDPDTGVRNATSYKHLAQAYARVVASLALPPSTSPPLYVTIGNEFNACNEWRCTSARTTLVANMTEQDMASQVAGFYRDVGQALRPVRAQRKGRMQYAHGAIANWNTSPCACNTGTPLGPGRFGLSFINMMLQAVPTLYHDVDWLSSHSYPFSQSGWDNPKCKRGLLYYRNESNTIAAVSPAGHAAALPLPVIITETGWNLKRNHTEENRANWTVLAYEQLRLPDPQVLGVTPFLLGGAFWNDKGGWPWMAYTRNGTRNVLTPTAVFRAVQTLQVAKSRGVNNLQE